MAEETEKRKVHRSPSYPVFDLAEAIEKTSDVYKSEKRTATTADVIASHLGYGQAKGPGGRAVSALRQFGLLEDANGKTRISDLGYTLIHFDRESAEWTHAAQVAARTPGLFRELLEEYPNGELPSDATMRNELLRRGFNPSAISDVVSIFRNTVALANDGIQIYNEDTMTTVAEEPVALQAQGKTRPPTPPAVPTPLPTAGMRQDVFSLAEGPVTIQWPASLSADSYQDLGDWLDIVKRKIGRSVDKLEPKE